MILNTKSSAILFCLLLHAGLSQADDVLWQSGTNLYIKLTDQDQSKQETTPPNQHPVQLNASQVSSAIEGIEAWSGGGFFKKKKLKTLFSLQQSRLLGQYISAGLSRARPDQDIVFVLARSEKKYVVIQNRGYTGGRVFYLDGKLHIIIGDYDNEGDRFKETAYKSHGVTDVKQYFKHGRRVKPSGFKGSIVIRAGVTPHTDGKKARRDWLEVDLEQAASVYLAEKKERQPQEAVTSQAMQAETARMARDRREMRLELAKMRKEMKSSTGGNSSQTIEQRLTTLQELRDKELISAEEYEQKREQLLGEI